MIRKKQNKAKLVLVDTSVVIAGIAALKKPPVEPYNNSQKVLGLCLSSKFIWVVADEILEEYKRVLKVLKVRANVAGLLINKINELGMVVNPFQDLEISPDPDDNMFYSCALESNAHYIVTLNNKDFPQIGKQPKILTPKEFSELFWP